MGYYRAGGTFWDVLDAAGKVWKGRKPSANVDRFSGEPGQKLGMAVHEWLDPQFAAALKGDEKAIRARWPKEGEMGYYRAGGVLMSAQNAPGWQAPAFGGASGSQLVLRPPELAAAGPGAAAEDAPYRRPRMNPTNIRALRRSMRRVTSFARIARGVMQFTKTHKMKGRRKRAFGK